MITITGNKHSTTMGSEHFELSFATKAQMKKWLASNVDVTLYSISTK